ncbi:MAG TPA: cation:proton antiporter [Chitinophagaceae bacterium]|nr:cation:proton antiporter [Chitinophagaceae bacterium]
MTRYNLIMLLLGLAAISMAWMPIISKKTRISYSIVFVLTGMALFALLRYVLPLPHPLNENEVTLRLTELVVIISLMGSGLRIDEPFSFRQWRIPFRLVSFTMILSIALVTLGAVYILGLPWPASLLLGAVLAPTDPVLASDVQVAPPNTPDANEVKFNLTAEAGMNDGSAFPFTWLAILVARAAGDFPDLSMWVVYFLLYKIIVGILAGWLIGKGLAWLLFTLPRKWPLWKTTDGLISLAATLVVYSVTEMVHGYGFIAVFVTAVTLRNSEMRHELHETLHEFIDQVERILVAVVLLLLGGSVIESLLSPLTLAMFLFCLAFVFIVRPLTAAMVLRGTGMTKGERMAVSFFGIKGIGSFYYLAFALGEEKFDDPDILWAITSCIVLISITIHGLTATSVMKKLE